ncbi:hypothetical protein [Sagittula sp. S175]|uniref:hypothetical protein n=1 Tax=Sagittula sp. S175 TaxID=3415129 RepID=UPI003C7C9864
MQVPTEEDIAGFMMRASKLEFAIVQRDCQRFARTARGDPTKVVGYDVEPVSEALEAAQPFSVGYANSKVFGFLAEHSPSWLVRVEGQLGWSARHDFSAAEQSWLQTLKNYAQLRNNVAHGNKMLPAAETGDRTEAFLGAARNFQDEVARLLDLQGWNADIQFSQ